MSDLVNDEVLSGRGDDTHNQRLILFSLLISDFLLLHYSSVSGLLW